jgi:hypothetical protein
VSSGGKSLGCRDLQHGSVIGYRDWGDLRPLRDR